jgi:hypothetical protein
MIVEILPEGYVVFTAESISDAVSLYEISPLAYHGEKPEFDSEILTKPFTVVISGAFVSVADIVSVIQHDAFNVVSRISIRRDFGNWIGDGK